MWYTRMQLRQIARSFYAQIYEKMWLIDWMMIVLYKNASFFKCDTIPDMKGYLAFLY